MKDIIIGAWAAIKFWELGIVVIFSLFCYILHRLDRAKDTSFKFHDFFTSGDWNGKASVARMCYFGAFLASSLALLHQEMKGGVDWTMLGGYSLIWSGAYVALKMVDAKNPQLISTTPPVVPTGDINGPKPT